MIYVNNEDYTKLYNILIDGINKYDSSDNRQLVQKISETGAFNYFLSTINLSEIRLGKEINRALLNLKEDGMIRASVTPIKLGQYIFTFDGLTTKGHNYLAVVNTPKAWLRVKKALDEAGVPLTPSSAGKFIGKLFV